MPHVTLPAVPMATAPEAERVSAFQELRPISTAQTVNLGTNPWLNNTQPFLLLNNGQRVVHPSTSCRP